METKNKNKNEDDEDRARVLLLAVLMLLDSKIINKNSQANAAFFSQYISLLFHTANASVYNIIYRPQALRCSLIAFTLYVIFGTRIYKYEARDESYKCIKKIYHSLLHSHFLRICILFCSAITFSVQYNLSILSIRKVYGRACML